MNKYYVYKHTTPSGKVYIGITRQRPAKRWRRGHGYKEDSIFYLAVLKYGWDNIKHEILYEGLTEEEASKKEIELIALYNSQDREHGYNVAPGGSTTAPTEIDNKKRSDTMKKKWGSAEYRKKMSESMLGVKRSEQARENISMAQKKRFVREEERRAVSEKQIGKKRTEEAKRKTSESLKAFYSNEENAKKMADKHRESNRITHGKKVRCVETGKVYDVINDAMKELGIDSRGISAVCKHKRKSAGGYKWEYA